MSHIEELRQTAIEQNNDAELPDNLLADIFEIIASPQRLEGKEELVTKLISQLRNFDLYAGTGCFSESCSVKDISDTLQTLSSP